MSNMVINTNVLALNSHRAMKQVSTTQATASARLSSGLKINSAADDAAGLAISEKMRAQIRGLDMASKNSQDSISLIQTAEGGMQEIDNMIQRMRELVVQASNDTNEHNTAGSGDRQKIQDEIDALMEEIDSMANRVEFNKKKVINGTFDSTTTLSSVLDPDWELDTAYVAASAAYDAAVAAHQPFQDDVDAAKIQLDAATAAWAAVSNVADYSDAYNAVDSLFTQFDALITELNSKIAAYGGSETGNFFSDLDLTAGNIYSDFATIGAIQAKVTDGTYSDGADAAATLKDLLASVTTGINSIVGNDFLGADLTNANGNGLDLTSAGGASADDFTRLKASFESLLGNVWDKAFTDLAAAIDGGNMLAHTAFTAATDNLTYYEGVATTTQGDLTDAETDLAEAMKAAQAANTTTTDGKGLWFQVGANANQGWTLEIRSVTTDKLGIGDGNGKSTISVLEDSGIDITATLDTMDTALSYVTTERSRLGAAQNRLEYTIKSLDISSENLSAAESRIRDTDMAKEMMTFTKANVLQQAAISMLAQANQAPQNVLTLLR